MSSSTKSITAVKPVAEHASSLLVAENLYKAYRRRPAVNTVEVLRGASLQVAAGEMVAVMGASGAGKSTLLHVLGGLEASDSGTVRLDGFDMTRAGAAELTRFRNSKIGFVFQFHHLLEDLTALENVALPLFVARRKRAAALTEARQLLEQVGLQARLSHKPGELSGGEAQRVAIARALVCNPRFVLADEPTGNLDQAIGDEIGHLLRALTVERQAATIVATHNERLARLCHRTLQLVDGLLREA